MELYRVTPDSLPLFRPYLLPQAQEAVAEMDGDVLALGAVEGGHSVGAVCGQAEGDVLRLRSLYVDPAARRRGIATALVRRLERALPRPRLSADYISIQDDGLTAFFTAIGFPPPKPVSRVYRVTLEELRGVPVVFRALRPDFQEAGEVAPLYGLPPRSLEGVYAEPGLPEYLRPELYAPWADGTLSLAFLEGGQATAYVVVTRAGPGELLLSAAYARPGAPRGAMLQLVMALICRAARLGEAPLACYISALDRSAMGLLRRLTGMDQGWTEWRTELELGE